MSTPSCPCCAGNVVWLIGKLPDSHWFAGERLSNPLAGGSLYRCLTCSLKFRHPVQDSTVYEMLYDNEGTSVWPVHIPRRDWDLIIEYISKHRPHAKTVLDFGCYTGGLLARLGSAYVRYGVEINRASAAIASESIHGRVWATIDDIPSDLRFDIVIAADVIEHVKNPITFIDRLGTLLTDHGILVVTTGDADNSLWNRFGANWWYCFFPEHIAFVSKAWLDYHARASGMTVIHCEAFRYCHLTPVLRSINFVLTYCYGWFPAIYLLLGGFLKKMWGRPGMTSVPGVGVTRDHLLIALAKSP